MVIFDEDKQKRKLGDLLKKEEEDLVHLLAQKYGIEYVDLSTISVNTDALRLVDEHLAYSAKLAPFAIIDRRIKIASRNPGDQKTADIVASLKQSGYEPELLITSTASLEKAWKGYKDISFAYETKAGSLDIANEEISKVVSTTKSMPEIQTLLKDILAQKKSYRVSRMLETIIAGAVATSASDIHLEPEQEYIRLRYRLDGVLVDIISFDTSTYSLLLSRLKLLSGLKLNIKKDAQDGRFSVKVNDTEIEIRTSILPGAYNESIVLRLLNPKSITVPLEELGIPKKLLSIILQQIDKPNGMVLTTGPTGSGKTTTLYAFLKKVYGPSVKIITIEDPIEYHLEGITQTQVNEQGYNFLEGLRSTLRQDPDIIMIGEIRDGETAAIAINSALTGHLVFSTLHTNDAAGAFPRLLDLGINPHVISSAINITLAQRLVRKLCIDCKKEIENTNPKIQKIIESIIDKSEIPQTSKLWQHTGCEKCNHTGYKGRIGIYEGILTDPEVNRIVESGGSAQDIKTAALPQAILTMAQDGVIKALQGVTSIEELERVIEISI